ncbi:MAG: hypothetical protein CM1200mP23_1660 [Nitrososphaerota archaeon]|nr:MAG: hypothetical protein CM1200mP23_1660 [Nitrososphaerota archaeon]
MQVVDLGKLSACFVLGMPDDMAGIMKSTSDPALIFKSGGGSESIILIFVKRERL